MFQQLAETMGMSISGLVPSGDGEGVPAPCSAPCEEVAVGTTAPHGVPLLAEVKVDKRDDGRLVSMKRVTEEEEVAKKKVRSCLLCPDGGGSIVHL